MAVCHLPDEIIAEFKKLKLARDPVDTALILKINPRAMVVEKDSILEKVSIEDIAQELPDSSPRYIIYSFKYTRPDGRMSYPIVFIFYCPREIQPNIAMLYTSTKQNVIQKLEILKTWDAQEPETLTTDWLKEKMAFFK
eukprot:TRINITY_DN3195_c0_g1_i1.p1 TRINITY_DN3195_c0_g1~~TRINITY_DN3195_c0_g1_i1.p1  ORF type:complete len:139 (+),score=18.14 TRINITY_DN3195_c0_g1_i1:178-594(+)